MVSSFVRLTLLFLAVLFGGMSVSEVRASNYVYRNGYYYSGSQAYTRYWYQPPGYYSYGSYYYPPGYYVYTAYYPPAASTYTPSVNYTDPDWRSKLLDLAAQRDKAEGKIRVNAFEQKYFLEAVEALGLKGNFNWQGYGQAPPYSVNPYSSYGNLQLSTAGAQGSTVYGYSYNTIASFYGDVNLSQLYQQAQRLAENAQQLSGQATTEFGALISQEGNNRAKVAEILAKAQATREFLKGLQGSGGEIKIQGKSFRVGPEKNVEPPPMAPPQNGEKGAGLNEALKNQWIQSASTRCYSCHGQGGKKDGGFDVQTYPSLSPEAREDIVRNRLLTKNPEKGMPRGKDGKHAPLPLSEIGAWVW